MGQGDTETILAKPTRSTERVLGDGSVLIGNTRYPVFISRVADIPVIANTELSTDNWTQIASSLTNVVMWDLSERGGDELQYAYVAAPGDDYKTLFGWKSFATSLTDLWVRRKPGSPTLNAQLEYWQYD